MEDIIEAINNAGSGSVDVFGGHFTGGYRIQQNPGELGRFIDFCRGYFDPSRELSYLEIGAAALGTTRFITEWLRVWDARVIDIGNHPDIPLARTANRVAIDNVMTRRNGVFKLCEADTRSSRAFAFLEYDDVDFDIVLIDADHSYASVIHDFNLARPHVVPDGIIAFHDTECLPDVRRAVDYIVAKHGLVKCGVARSPHEQWRKGLEWYRLDTESTAVLSI